MSTTTHIYTADDLMRLPDDGNRYELVKGELLTMSPPGYEHGLVALNLASPLKIFVTQHKLGSVVVGDPGFRLASDPDTVLAPDIAFIRAGRLKTRPRDYARIVPDLVVEVVSPGDRRSKVVSKAKLWLSFGVESVWVVRPDNRSVEVFSQDGMTRVFVESEIMSDSVLPGFEIPVRVIFE